MKQAITETSPLPTPVQLAWHRTETNVFFHFGINTFSGREWGDGTESPRDFNPTALDCRQWARAARAGGFKVGILTAKHHDGFCLWPSCVTEHTVKNSPWRNGQGDLVKEFVDAFRAEGLEVGLYLSPWDRHEACYGDSPRYDDFYCKQLEELLTNYGELREVWFDGACDEGPNGRTQIYDWKRYFELVKKLQPNAVTFGDGGTDVRWVGNERGFAGETCWGTVDPDFIRNPGDSGIAQANDARADIGKGERLLEGDAPDGSRARIWRPAECDVSIRPGWFYHEEQNDKVRTVDNLIDLYFKSVGRNGVLLLNLPITPEGLVHQIDAERVTQFRAEKDRLFAVDLAADATAEASSELADRPVADVLDSNPNCYWQSSDDTCSATIIITLPETRVVSVLCLQEAIFRGQHVSQYQVEVRDAAGDWSPLLEGTTIGHKRLHLFESVMCSAVRLTFLESFEAPALESIRLY